MDEEKEREEADEKFEKERDEVRKRDEERTEKKRREREKARARKGKKGGKGAAASGEGGVDGKAKFKPNVANGLNHGDGVEVERSGDGQAEVQNQDEIGIVIHDDD